MSTPSTESTKSFPQQDLPERIVSLQEAARLLSISSDTIRRRHRDKLIRLSPNRLGMRLRDALMLGSTEA